MGRVGQEVKKNNLRSKDDVWTVVLSESPWTANRRSPRFSLSIEISRLTRAGLPNPYRKTKFSGANGDISCSADHKHDWRPYPVDLYCTWSGLRRAGLVEEVRDPYSVSSG